MSMKLKLLKNLETAVERIEVTDPWETDLHLHVLRAGSPLAARRLQRFGQAFSKKLIQKAGGALARKYMMNAGKIELDVIEATFDEAFEQLDLGDPEMELFSNAKVLQAVSLLDGWSGGGAPRDDAGEILPCTEENKRALFGFDDVLIPEGQPLAGRTLGEALIDLVIAASEGHEKVRELCLEEAGKGSGPGTDGASVPGPETPSPDAPSAPDSTS